MNGRRLWTIAGSAVIVAILGLGWFLGVSPVLDTAAASSDSREQVEATNANYEQQLAALAKEFENIDKLRDELGTATKHIPGNAGVADLLRQLTTLQQQTGAVVTGVTLKDAQFYVPPTAAAPAPTAAPTDSATPAPDSTAAPAAPTTVLIDPSAGIAPTDPAQAALVSTGNFLAIPVTLEVTGDVNQMLAFVTGLQGTERLFLVTKFSTGGEGATGSVDGLIYVLIDPTATQQATAQ